MAKEKAYGHEVPMSNKKSSKVSRTIGGGQYAANRRKYREVLTGKKKVRRRKKS